MGRGITWDDKLDAKLLFAIISTSAPKINYEAVAKIISNDCTPNAIWHRLARIKLKADEGNSASSSPAKTPNSKAGGGHAKPAKKRTANNFSEDESRDIKKVKQEHVQESDTDE
ncbi:hypothetical protein TESG_00252 [Trichophyton tonsurans CBS 112818]|uniref:Uncharacterized protein n=2 Tax=Trichophyton TaxID=5550 RepID=F2Q4S8_TRIEC|nr:hypothetical protein TESG_00252 [Trichophyton tonsurans CBS 112818]EGE09146.1 hypothetical protein TEQG_08100 [Trichophyton equinum CBS 127.97]